MSTKMADVMNITVLYDPRSTRALLSMKYHYLPILTILAQIITFNLRLAVYPAEKYGDDYFNMFGQENYVQNCVSFFERNLTEKLAIMDCILHCELCSGLNLCPIVFTKNTHTPGCIKRVKGDLQMLVKCELKKRFVSARAHRQFTSDWDSFHSNSSNPIVLYVNGKKQKTNIMDTGLTDSICSQALSGSNIPFCQIYKNRKEISRILIDDGHDHVIISKAHCAFQSFLWWIYEIGYYLAIMIVNEKI